MELEQRRHVTYPEGGRQVEGARGREVFCRIVLPCIAIMLSRLLFIAGITWGILMASSGVVESGDENTDALFNTFCFPVFRICRVLYSVIGN